MNKVEVLPKDEFLSEEQPKLLPIDEAEEKEESLSESESDNADNDL